MTASTLTRPPLLLTMTDAHTGDAHLVTEEAVIAGRRAGRYVAVCGSKVLAASMTRAGAQTLLVLRPVGRPVTPLIGPDLFAWMALRRVHAGGVAKPVATSTTAAWCPATSPASWTY